MQTEVIGQSGFQSVEVQLGPGESFVSEAGKMLRMSSNIDVDVTTESRGSGGILSGIGRVLGGGTFFLATYTPRSGGGEVVLSPTLIGAVSEVEVTPGSRWMCTGGSYLASGSGVRVSPTWQGIKGMMSGESMVFIEAEGSGPLFVEAFGAIREVEVDGTHVVDTGHVVAFETSLDYSTGLLSSSWFDSFFSGEGFVTTFEGHGRLLVQSHNRRSFGIQVGTMLPPREPGA